MSTGHPIRGGPSPPTTCTNARTGSCTSGVFATATGTYFDQSGEFFRIGQAPSTDMPTSGSDQFWIFDASVGYRLPDRWGIVSIEARNLFDRSFQYQDTDPFRPIIQPGRTVYFKVTLSL
jgi:outer membrane receptor protein involved in Fe transport